MGRLHSIGYELNSNVAGVEWSAVNGTGATIQSTTVRGGSYAGKILNPATGVRTGWAHQITNTLPADFYCRLYLCIHTRPNVRTSIGMFHDSTSLTADSAPRGGIELDTDGTLVLTSWQTGARVQIGSASAVLALDTWYRIEMRQESAAAAGSNTLQARLDGTQFAGSTTQTVTNDSDCFRIGANLKAETCTSGEWYFDDLAWNDSTGTDQNSWPGDGAIVHLHPDSTGWQCVDEVTPDDATSYWSLLVDSANSTSPDRLDVNCEAFTPSAASITLVSVGTRTGATTAASCSWVPRVKSQASGTVVEGVSSASSSTSFNTFTSIATTRQYRLTQYTDPQAGGPWTVPLLNSMQIGVRAPDATPDVKVTTLWALVEYVPADATSPAPVATPAILTMFQ
jgi:hypothetical protein